MANNPLEANEIRFWLKFNSLGHTNWYQIVEPIGFDGAEFVIEQEPKRFARSIRYGAIDKLKFIDEFGQDNGVQQTINPLGDTSTYLDYGLQWLLYIYNEFGFEMDVEFKITIGNTDFVIYSLDANDKDITDRYTYFQCKLIDNSKTMDYKRRYDDKLNALGDKDVFENTIAPVQSINYLHKAVSRNEESIFELKQNEVLGQAGFPNFFNPIKINTKFEIKNTLAFIISYPIDPDPFLSFSYIKAKTNITNLNIKFDVNYIAPTSAPMRAIILVGTPGAIRTSNYIQMPVGSSIDTFQNLVNIPTVYIGERVAVYFLRLVTVQFLPSKITLNAISTPLNSVIKAVRYADLLKHYNKMIWNLPYYAPYFDVGGKHFNQFIFNKEMVSQKTDKLYFTGKELIENTFEEVACDTEISDAEFHIGEYHNYYTNDEILVANVLPSEEFNIDTNDRFACNKSIYNYDSFAQERELIGTSQVIHGQSEFKLQNIKVENVFERKVDFIRDPFEIQNIVDLEIKKPTTSVEQDFKKCLEDAVLLPPNAFNIIFAILLIRQVGGNLEILNRDSEGDTDDFVVNWLTTGMAVGQPLEVLTGANGSVGMYTIIDMTVSVLTLQPVLGNLLITDGNYFMQLKHFYSNVLWQTRINEGFSFSANLPNNFGNKFYTIKRNLLNYWSKYIASMLLGSKKDIINSFFKSNGIAETQLITESVPVIENAPITYASLPIPILTQNIINLTIVSEFNEQIALLNTYQSGVTTNAPRRKGYGRFFDINGNVILGYIQKSSFNISTNKFTLTIEERYEPALATVTVSGGVITVNDRTYQLSGISNWWKTQNDYIQFFDNKNKPICNLYRYNFINLNGVTYSSINDLVIALNSLP